MTATIPKDELVELCRLGDPEGYRKIYQLYSRAMYNTSLRILNNPADAEDVLQEAFLDAFRFIKDFEYRSTFGAWLKRIVVNKSINMLKSRRLIAIQINEEIDLPVMDEEIDTSDQQFKVERIREAIQQLPDGYRTVLSLYLLEGYDQEEIASILGITHTTVRTQYMRAKHRLLCFLKMNKHEN